jgi:hypothetical protein
MDSVSLCVDAAVLNERIAACERQSGQTVASAAAIGII